MQTTRALLVALAMWCPVLSTAADLGGTVRSAAGDLVPGAAVELVELRRETTTGPAGEFRFTDIPAGDYLLAVSTLSLGSAFLRVAVPEDGASVDVELDQRVHSGAVTVTATGRARGLGELAAPVDVLADEELVLRREATLGDTLEAQPGIAATGYGRGSSRPVIRGLDADRIRILENGLDAGDVSSIGPDHGVSVEPLTAERIEVVRGPATLLYGGTAVGGVVNVIDNRIPDRVPTRPVTGVLDVSGGSNADELAGAATVDGGGGSFAWHLDGFWRDSDDYSSPVPHPGVAHDEDEEGEEELVIGRVENSFVETEGGAAGLSWIGERGYVGLSFGAYDSRYGVPGHSHGTDEDEREEPGVALEDDHDHDHDHEEHDHGGVFVDLEQRRLDLHARYDAPFAGVETLQARFGWRDYQHQEIEGSELGTLFSNELFEGRIEALLAPVAGFEGIVGVNFLDRDFAATGEEAYVQPTTTRRLAGFVIQELPAEPWGVQLGARFERQDTSSSDPGLPDRDFGSFSASAGVSYALSEGWLVSLAASRSERAPTAEELYSDGPHAATFSYEIGDPGLDGEVGAGLDLTLRTSGERFGGSIAVFATRFDDYLYLADTGEIRDGLTVRQFTQADAEFSGFELHGDLELLHRGAHHLHAGLILDQVRAELVDTGEPLPRIPPRSALLKLNYFTDELSLSVEGRWVDEQDRVAAGETSTPDFVMLGASIGYRFVAGGLGHELRLKGTNLTDEEALNHVSFLKEQAPLPGRNVVLGYRLLF